MPRKAQREAEGRSPAASAKSSDAEALDNNRPQLVGIGTDPGLLDRNGRFLSQRDPKGSAWLVDGVFVDEEPGEPSGSEVPE